MGNFAVSTFSSSPTYLELTMQTQDKQSENSNLQQQQSLASSTSNKRKQAYSALAEHDERIAACLGLFVAISSTLYSCPCKAESWHSILICSLKRRGASA